MLLTNIPYSREVFFCNHREHESQVHVVRKANLSPQDKVFTDLFMKCYLRGTLNDLRFTTFFIQKILNRSQHCELPAHSESYIKK